MSRQDRLRLIAQGVSARLAQMPSQWRSRIFGEHASLVLPEPPRHDEELLSRLHAARPGPDREALGCDPRARCFAVEGARAAHEFVHSHGAGDERAHTVAEAISLHLNVTVPARLGTEAHLLSKGVSLDVVGRRLHQISPVVTASVNEPWPRDGFADELAASTTMQAHMRPNSRSALLHKLGFVKLLEGNPVHDVS